MDSNHWDQQSHPDVCVNRLMVESLVHAQRVGEAVDHAEASNSAERGRSFL